ncbi:MAG: hypothetical protein A2X46_12355 [Lentisphaerae bacterium GWF2_57_35]|nr:MAG: hypothetical protein A2X46_12355 [Lentisphaerae bacterium GWF2_57_35]
MYAGFGAILLLLVALSSIVYVKLSDISRESEESLHFGHYETVMVEREVDHLKWVRTLESLFLGNLDKVELQLDPTQCGLGKFLYGEDGKKLSDADPSVVAVFEDLKGPHQRLHESAKAILQGWQRKHAGLSELLMARLDDHRRWVATLSQMIIEKNPNVQLQEDPRLCAFGKFLESEQFAGYADAFPLFKTVMEKVQRPHKQLHESAAKITAALKAGRTDEASAIFAKESIPAVDQIQKDFNEVISAETSIEAAQAEAFDVMHTKTHKALAETQAKLKELKNHLEGKSDSAGSALEKDVRGSKWVVGFLSVAALLIGLVISVALTRSITGPILKVIEGLTSGSKQVTSASGEVSSASQMLAQGASEQASSLEETSSALEEMAAMTRQNADNAGQANSTAKEASSLAARGVEAMERMSASIEKIKKSSDATAKIIKTIDEIAFQTNLLALNAAVEAARAGEAGKGFAVVAEEVRNLARRSAEAAKNTADLIEGAQKNSEEGVSVTSEAARNLGGIKESVGKVATLIAEIAAASKEQTQGIEQINTAVSEMDKVVQQNAAGAEESASASEELSAQAQELNAMVDQLIKIVHGDGARRNAAADAAASRPQPKRSAVPATGKMRAKGAPAPAARTPASAKQVSPEEVIPLDEQEFKDF